MAPTLPPLSIPSPADGEEEFWDAMWDAQETIDRHVQLALRLYSERSEGFYEIARQVKAQAQQFLNLAHKVTDTSIRQDCTRTARRALSVISFLTQYGPYVEGWGGQSPARPSRPIKSVTSGGLPGLGKRH